MKDIEYYQKLSKEIEFRDGLPFWILPGPRRTLNKPAGTVNNRGYRQLGCTINGILKLLRAHRVHWFMMYGVVPREIDHINRIKDDNRIENLRTVTSSQNQRNKNPTGSSRYVGVCWHKRDRKWQASCNLNGRYHYLGVFKVEVHAAKAYDKFCIDNNLTHTNLNFPEEVKK